MAVPVTPVTIPPVEFNFPSESIERPVPNVNASTFPFDSPEFPRPKTVCVPTCRTLVKSTALSAILVVVIAEAEILGAEAVVPSPPKSPANLTRPNSLVSAGITVGKVTSLDSSPSLPLNEIIVLLGLILIV